MCVCFRPPASPVCLNHEVLELQPWTLTGPDLGSDANAYTVSNPPAPPVPTVFWIVFFPLPLGLSPIALPQLSPVNATTQDRQVTGPPVEASRGGGAGVRLMEAGRGRKGPLDGRDLGLAGTWAQVEDGKGGNRTGEGRHGSCEELLWSARNGR